MRSKQCKIESVDTFAETYRRLNDAQRQAVDTIDGPMLVLAGPGTGKTQLLSARVANILTKTDTDPSNIICLTFTVNAANNMRERLRSMIGTSANHVVIKTFHSLAADIIANRPEHFYAGAVLNPISELAAQEMIQSILASLPHDSPLVSMYDGKYIHLGNVLQAIGRAKDAGLSPVKLQTVIDEHAEQLAAVEPDVVELFSATLSHKSLEQVALSFEDFARAHDKALASAIAHLVGQAVEADLPTGKTTQTGKLKTKFLSTENGQKVMARERRANAWWQALTTVYEQYQALLYKRGYLDYSDMLVSVIDALEADEDVRLDIQESTQYLLVDEFQDSNNAQIKLLHLLADNPHIETPNIMVVGDPNQTIYGFNGAMLDNIADFQQFYTESLTTIDLTSNYRSSQAILDESSAVISPYSPFQPDLHAENEPKTTAVRYTIYATEADQAVQIAQAASAILQKTPDASVAVLARDHASLSYLSRCLTKAGLTVNYDQSIDIRTTSCNQLIIAVLSLVQAITVGDKTGSDHYLAALLRHPALGLTPNTTWQIALQTNRSQHWIDVAATQQDTKPVIDWVHRLVGVNASQPLHVLIEQLLSSEFMPGKTMYQQFYAGDTDETMLVEAQATKQLINLAKQYAQTEQVSLISFLGMLQGTSDKLFMFSPSSGHYEQAVTLMSVHGAKGLEFDHVFIIDSDEAHWKPRTARYATPLSLPVHVNLDTPADYARLMYVAMTRAKQGLYVSYVSRIDAKTTALPAEQLGDKPFEAAPLTPDRDLALADAAQLIPERPTPKAMHELLSDTLARYQLSATALTHFLDLNREGMDTFIEEQLLRLPQPTSEVLAHGNAMHAAMELAQIQTANGALDIPAIKRLYAHKIGEESLTSAIIDRLTDRANARIDALFSELGLTFDPASQPEQSFSATTLSGMGMYGKIDRVDTLDDHTVRIVDYKTGKPITNPASKAQDVLLKQWRHKLQLGFYVLLMKQQKAFANKTIHAQIIQLDAADPAHLCLDYELDNEELQRIEQLATAVYKRIMTLDIPDVTQFEPTLSGIKLFEDWLLTNTNNHRRA